MGLKRLATDSDAYWGFVKGHPMEWAHRVKKGQVACHPCVGAARKRLQWQGHVTGLVKKAIVHGDLVRQPCEVCGADKAHGHHDNYDEPLTVRWLCSRHHIRHHLGERIAEMPPRGGSTAVKLPTLKCKRCGHGWTPRQEEVTICPKCKRETWDDD